MTQQGVLKSRPKGWSRGLVVMGDNSCSRGCGFESQCCILDGHIFSLICCKNCVVCLKRLKMNVFRGC